jgi:hypothetical protein
LSRSDCPDQGAVNPVFWKLEMPLIKVPAVVNSSMSADAWNPPGHAVVLPQVGSVVRGAGPMLLSVRAPGRVPTPACANPAVTSPVPTMMPIIPMKRVARRRWAPENV